MTQRSSIIFLLLLVCPLARLHAGPADSKIEITTSALEVAAGEPLRLTVRLRDRKGDSVSYVGTVELSTGDQRSTVPGTLVEFSGELEMSVTVRMGTVGKQTIWARTASIDRDSVQVTVLSGPAVTLVVSTASVVEAGSPLSIRVVAEDEFGNFSPVTAAAEASLAGDTALFTISSGRGSATLVPTRSGLHRLDVGSLSEELTGSRLVEVLTSAPAALSISSGDGQSADRGKLLGRPFTVVVADRFGNPARDVPVTFSVTSGGITFDGGTSGSGLSDGEGLASSPLAFAGLLGSFSVSAAAEGIPAVTFTGDVVQRVARFEIAGLPPVVVAGDPLPDLELRAVDHIGVLVPTLSGVTVARLDGADAPNGSAAFPGEIAISFRAGKALLSGVVFARAGKASIEVRHPERTEIATATPVDVLAASPVALTALRAETSVTIGTATTLAGTRADRFGNAVPEAGAPVTLAVADMSGSPGRFIAGPSQGTRRLGARAARTGGGKLLIAGGTDESGTPILPALLFDPATHTFHPGPTLVAARTGHSATELPDGGVLVFGGSGPDAPPAERYDPVSRLFAPLSGPPARSGHTATALPDGRVLLAGGYEAGAPSATTWLFDSSTGEFSPGPALPGPLVDHAALSVSAGALLLGGSDGGLAVYSTVVLFDAASGELRALGHLLRPRAGLEAVLLDAKTVLVWGGTDGEIFDLSAGASRPAGKIEKALAGARLTRIAPGKALLSGGALVSGTSPEKIPQAMSYVFDLAAGGFVPGPPMVQPRFEHLAFPTLPDSGRIVLFGGGPATSELFISSLALKGSFSGGAREITVKTDASGRFEAELIAGEGRQKIHAASPGLSGATFVVEGRAVARDVVRLGFEGLPSVVGAGDAFGGTLVALDHTGARVEHSGLAEVTLDGAGPFPDRLLVYLTGGTASLGEVRLAGSGRRVLGARLLDNSTIGGGSDPVDVLPGEAVALEPVSGAGQEVLPGSRLGGPVVVRALDLFRNPVPGAAVEVSAERGDPGALALSTSGAGEASVDGYVAPAAAGADALRLRLAGLPDSEIAVPLVVVSPVAPDRLVAVEAVAAGLPGGEATLAFRATAAGLPLGGLEVRFHVISGDATLSAATTVTDSAGIARIGVRSSAEGRVMVEAGTAGLVARAEAIFAPAGAPVLVSVDLPALVEAGSPIAITLRLTDATGAVATGIHLIHIELSGATSPSGLAFPASFDLVVSGGEAMLDDVVFGSTAEAGIAVSHVGVIESPPTARIWSGLLALLGIEITAAAPDRVVVLSKRTHEAVPGELVEGAFEVGVADALGNPVSGQDVSFQFIDGDSYFEDNRVPWAVVISDPNGRATCPALRAGRHIGTHLLWAGAGPDRTTLELHVKHAVLKIVPDSPHKTLAPDTEYRLLSDGMPGEVLARPEDGRNPHLGVTIKLKEADPKKERSVGGLLVEYTLAEEPGEHASADDGLFHKTASFYRVAWRKPDPAKQHPGLPVEPLIEQLDELGPRAVVETNEGGMAGSGLMLRLPRKLDETHKAWVRVRVRVLSDRGIVDPKAASPYPTAYLQIPIRPPVIFTHGKAGDDPVALSMIAGSPARAFAVGTFELARKTPAAGEDLQPYPNGQLYCWVRKLKEPKEGSVDPLADKYEDASKHFFFNWREVTTRFLPAGSGAPLWMMPKADAPAGDYDVIVGAVPKADPEDKTLEVKPFVFKIKVKKDFPVDEEKDFIGPTMIVSGGFQRTSVGKEDSPAGGAALPDPLKLDFRKSKVFVKLVEHDKEKGTIRVKGVLLPPAVADYFKIAGILDVPVEYDADKTNLTRALLAGECVTLPLAPKLPLPPPFSTLLCGGEPVPGGLPWRATISEKIPQKILDLLAGLPEGDAEFMRRLLLPPRVRVEHVLGLRDWRARLVQKNEKEEFVALKGPLFTTEVVGSDGTAYAAIPALEFYIELRAGDLGKIAPHIAAQGLPLVETRRGEGPSDTQAGITPHTWFDSGSALLQRYGISRAVASLPPAPAPDFGPVKSEGERTYRFGPYRLTNQILSSLFTRETVESASGASGPVSFLQAGRGLVYSLRGTAGPHAGFVRAELEPRVHQARSLRLVASNGARNIPDARDFVPELSVSGKGTVLIEEPTKVDIDIRDPFADVAGKHETKKENLTAPTEVEVQYVQGSFVSEPKKFSILFEHPRPDTPDIGRPDPFTGRAVISVLGVAAVPVTRVTVTVTNKLGTTGQLVFELRHAATGRATVHVLQHCRASHPSVYYAGYEPPGEKELPESAEEGKPHTFAATVKNIGSTEATPLELTLTRLGEEREYRSAPFLVIRTPKIPAALKSAGLPVVWVTSDSHRVQLATATAPLLEGPTLTHTIVSRPRPVLWVHDDPADDHSALHSTDTVRDGDRFLVTFDPDYRTDPADDKIEVIVGVRLPDGTIDPESKQVLTLERSGSSYTSRSDTVQVTSDPEHVPLAGVKTLQIPGPAAELAIELVDRKRQFELPVVSAIIRQGGEEKNPFEALSGASPQVGFGVYVHNQEQVFRLPLHSVPSERGMDYQLVLVHRTRITFPGSVGASWTHNYDLRLRRVRVKRESGETDEQFHFYDGQARYIRFTKKGTAWEPEPGAYLSLEPAGLGWRITGPRRTRIDFPGRRVAGFHLASRITDRNDNTIVLRYGPRGRLAEVIDALGRSYFYRHDKNGLLHEVVDFSGRRFRFAHGLLDLVAIEYPRVRRGVFAEPGAKNTANFEYREHRLTGYVDRRGVELFRNILRPDGRIEIQTLARTSRMKLELDSSSIVAGGVVGVTDGLGHRTDYVFGAGVFGPGAGLARSLPKRISRPLGLVTDLEHNPRGEPLVLISPSGRITRWTYADSASVRRRGDVTSITRTAGKPSVPESAPGYPAGYHTEATGHVKSVDQTALVTHFSNYTDFGQPKTITRPDGTVVTHEYDDRGNLEKRTHPAVPVASVSESGAVSKPKNQIGEEKWSYNKAGQVLTYTDELERKLHFHYYKVRSFIPAGEELPRVLAGGKPRLGGVAAAPTTNEHAERGGYLARIQDAAQGTEQSFGKDERGNTTLLVDERRVVHRYRYNAADQAFEERPADEWDGREGDGNALAAATFAGTARPLIVRLYDLEGNRRRTVWRERGGGGRAASETIVVDELGRVAKIERPIGDGTDAITHYERDAAGNLEKITGPAGRVQVFEYDEANRRKAEFVRYTDGKDAVRVDLVPDADGNVVSRKVFGADVTRGHHFYRDGHGRLVAELHPGGAVTLVTPDRMGRPLDVKVWGKGSRYTGGAGNLASRFVVEDMVCLSWEVRVYNDRGWLIEQARNVDPLSENSTWLQRLVRYDASGAQVAEKSLPRGAEVARLYQGRRVRWIFRNAGSTGAQRIRFDHDASGNVLTRTEQLFGKKTKLGEYITTQRFDGLGRKIRITPPDNRPSTFDHDWQGNLELLATPLESRFFVHDLLGRRTHEYRGDDDKGALMSVTGYYADGLVKSRTGPLAGSTTSYTYTAAGQVKTITYPGDTAAAPRKFEAAYSASGKLETTSDPNGTKVEYTVDEAGRITGRKVVATGSGVLDAGPQAIVHDGLGRPIEAWELHGKARLATEYRAHDGVGRTLAEGTSFAPPDGLAYPYSRFPRRVERLILTSFDDDSGSRTETLPFSGLTVVHTREEAELTGRWQAVGLGLQGETVSYPDGRLQRIGLGAGGSAARVTFDYKPATREFVGVHLHYGPGRSVEKIFSRELRKDNGLVKESTQDIGESKCTSTFVYTLSVELFESDENCQQHLRGTEYLHSRRTTGGVERDLAGNQTAATVVMSRETPEKLRVSTTITSSRPKGSIDAAGRYLAGTRTVDQIVTQNGSLRSLSKRTDESTLKYDNAGGLVEFSEHEQGKKELNRVIGLGRDAYGRLRQVTRTDDVPGGFHWVPSPGKGSTALAVEPVAFTTRNTITFLWYSPLGKRLHKYSELTLRRETVSRKLRVNIRQVKGEWYTVDARGLVREETSYLLEGAAGNPFVVHRGFVVDAGGHAAMVRWEVPGLSIAGPGKGTTELWSQHYILRDDKSNPHVLLGLAGQPAAQIDLGYDGELLGLSPRDTAGDLRYENPKALNYQYLFAGRKFDLETGFYDFGSRYYWPELGRFLSPDPAGAWANPASNGNPYTFAGNNPLLYIQPPASSAGPYTSTEKPLPFQEAGGLLHNALSLLRTGVGLGEIALGGFAAATAPGTFGGGVVVGGLLVAHGLSEFQAGLLSLASGRDEQSFTSLAIQRATGASRLQADLGDAAVGIALTFGAQAAISTGRAGMAAAERAAARASRGGAAGAQASGASRLGVGVHRYGAPMGDWYARTAEEALAFEDFLAAGLKWKGFGKGKLVGHFIDHGEELGHATQSAYLRAAKEFAAEAGHRVHIVGKTMIKYDATSRRLLIGHFGDREIRTFYRAWDQVDDPLQAAIDYTLELIRRRGAGG